MSMQDLFGRFRTKTPWNGQFRPILAPEVTFPTSVVSEIRARLRIFRDFQLYI